MQRLAPLTPVVVVALLWVATPLRAQEAGGEAALKGPWVAGEKTVFTERSPVSSMSVLPHRLGWPIKGMKDTGKPIDYDLKKETFQLFVPETYTGDEPFGVFVWISAGKSGALPPPWLEVLVERKIIAIGADGTGNDRETWSRLGLAIDAAHNLQKKYNVDPRRVFVGGGSGGGRCASMLGVCFPDVFRGGLYLVGCNSYHVLGPPGVDKVWKPGYVKPGRKWFDLAATRSRHVLLTGDGDMNREQTKVYYEAFVQDGFRNITYIEIPNFSHQMPSREWFDRAVALLEPADEGVADMPAKTPSAKPPQPRRPPVVSAPVSEAERLLSSAKVYVTNRRFEGARARLKTLVETYPDTAAAEQGKKLLKEIEGR